MRFTKKDKVVVVLAHADDEIMCGGTINMLVDQGISVTLITASASGFGDISGEVVTAEYWKSVETLGLRERDVSLGEFITREIWDYMTELKHWIYKSIKPLAPSLVITMSEDDCHLDHKAVSVAVNDVCKTRNVIQIANPMNGANNANVFIEVSDDNIETKMEAMSHYGSMKGRYIFDSALFEWQSSLNGKMIGCEYAEAYFTKRLLLHAL